MYKCYQMETLELNYINVYFGVKFKNNTDVVTTCFRENGRPKGENKLRQAVAVKQQEDERPGQLCRTSE